ncbi:MAG: response regulator [Patescibacteria group bacterium]|jgi:DNA-binding response OmpR family regulator
MPSRHIVIIEDEDILREVLVKKFIHEGFRVDSATNGEDGLALIQSARPDVVLLDILMPKMNGYEVLKNLQATGDKLPPIIIISNSGQPIEVDKAVSLGAIDFIIKAQITPEEVYLKVNKIFEPKIQKPKTQVQNDESQEADTKISKKSNGEYRILLVEDDQFLRDLLAGKLKREGFDVTACVDGQEGLRTIQKQKPDLVLLDIILPGLDGFNVLQQVRFSADKQVSEVPIVLLSNLGQDSDVAKGKKLGANDYLIKANLTIDDIIKKIRKFLK